MTRKSAYRALDQKLAADPSTILNATEIRLLSRELQRVLVLSLPGLSASILDRSDETIRWHAVGARCAQARGARGIRDVAVALGIPQYRLRAIEAGQLTEVRIELARRYFRFLEIEDWIARWCRANRELAARVGLIEVKPASVGRRVHHLRRD